MDIPEEVQDKLKCSECNELLSCGPVYLLHETGGVICGRCSQQSADFIDGTRIGPYEATASLLSFPCAHASRGCPEKVTFSLGRPPHELTCEFRPLFCPIAPREICDWIGVSKNIKEHSEEKHPLNVLKNPCNLPRPDLTTSNLRTYLISAFQLLFLLQIKVCVASGKLYHSVRMFGDSKLLDIIWYTLEIEGNNKKITDKGSVLRAGNLTIEEPTAMCTTINSLLDFLGGKYNDSKFTITIQTFQKCVNCLKTFDIISDSEICGECIGNLKKCKFHKQGCLFMDANVIKCEKHEMYFCEYQTKCCLEVKCGENFVAGSLFEHLISSASCRNTMKSNIESVVRVTLSSDCKYILFSTENIGTLICLYILCNSCIALHLRTSLPLHKLKNFKCSIELTDSQKKYTQILTPQIFDSEWSDWYIREKIDNFPYWKNGIDVKINIDKL